MGVTLERVQFKFASIIGELCSEPVVLSQFAVWLDLRLAEYKSKGAISLDCSGEKPDPSWLKGLRAAAAAVPAVKRVLGSRLAPRAGAGFARGGIHSRSSAFHRKNINSHGRLSHTGLSQSRPHQNTLSDNNSRLSEGEFMGTAPEHLPGNSEDVVLIKDEPSEDNQNAVYPVSLHSHQSNEPESRKRPSRDSLSSDNPDNCSTPYKVLKTPTDDSPLNQSLMSVLGNTFDDQNPDELAATSEANNSSVNEMDFSVSLQDQTGDSSFQSPSWTDNTADYQSSGPLTSSTSTFSPNLRPSASATVTSNSSLAGGSISTDTEQTEANVSQDDQESSGPEAAPKCLLQISSTRHIDSDSFGPLSTIPSTSAAERERKEELIQKVLAHNSAESTSKYIVGTVTAFERWLTKSSYKDHRKVEEIPAEQLDVYLADYFRVVKKQSGANYTLDSFRQVRSKLDHYLKCQNYPYSLIKSPIFVKSQAAFQERVKELQNIAYPPL